MLKVEVARAGEYFDDPSSIKGGILSVTDHIPEGLFFREEGHLPWAIEQAELIDDFLKNTIPAFVYDRLAILLAKHALDEGLLHEETEE